ncbi:MAG: NnrU family protein [Wenzhouxiangellaceae bacterium]|nr:NnrU family protein [Wenzhouxiangellaceae bacterium]
MMELMLGLLLFVGVHSVAIVAPDWRNHMASRLGVAWQALYSLLALAGLVLMVIGYGEARLQPTVLYSPPEWTRHLAMLLMLPVFPLLLAAYLPGRIQAALGHPMLAAVKLWALAHLLANGTLADALLFGVLLVWAVVDRISLERRGPRTRPMLPATRANDAIAIVGGLALYFAFAFWLHPAWIGVAVVG